MTKTLDIGFGEDMKTFFNRTIDAVRRFEVGEVLEDVDALKPAGLLDGDDENGLVVHYDEIRTVTTS